MVIDFSGWMNGGDVSTGTIQYLKFRLQAKKFVEINTQKLYFFQFSDAMQETVQFRPNTKIQNDLIVNFQYSNCFYPVWYQKILMWSRYTKNKPHSEKLEKITKLSSINNRSLSYYKSVVITQTN